MPIIIFKYPNKDVHSGRMRNVSGRKMKLLPAAVRAGPMPGLGDICSKLFTPWQTALHIYYGAVVQLPPRIMEVPLPIPPPPIGKKRGTKHESKMKSKTTAKTTGLQMIFDGFDGCSMRCFLLLFFSLLVSLFVCCVCPM